MTIEIRHLTPDDIDEVMAAGHLFDDLPRRDWTAAFLAREGHHMLLATVDDEPAGFVTGIENLHPDKGAEMLLYELGVDDAFRRRGIGRSLVIALSDLAVERGCSEMWVPIEPDNDAAIATYLSAGADPPEAAATMSWEFDE
jgi:ribosomal protein S18 acetylase RimI-like enzyme